MTLLIARESDLGPNMAAVTGFHTYVYASQSVCCACATQGPPNRLEAATNSGPLLLISQSG